MALTLSKVSQGAYKVANKRVRTYDVTFDSSYATGGLSLTPAQVDCRSILGARQIGRAGGATTAAVVQYDPTNQKLQAYVSNGASPALLAEAPATTNLSSLTVRLEFVGY